MLTVQFATVASTKRLKHHTQIWAVALAFSLPDQTQGSSFETALSRNESQQNRNWKSAQILGYVWGSAWHSFGSVEKKYDLNGDKKWPRSYLPAHSPFRLLSDCAKLSGRYDSHRCSVSEIDHVVFSGIESDGWEFQFDMLPNTSVRIELSEKVMKTCKLSGIPHPPAVIKQTASHREVYVNYMGVGKLQHAPSWHRYVSHRWRIMMLTYMKKATQWSAVWTKSPALSTTLRGQRHILLPKRSSRRTELYVW